MTRNRKSEFEKEIMGVKYIRIQKVAEMLAISVRTAWQKDADKLIPEGKRIGRAKWWVHDDLTLWHELECPDRATFNKLKQKSGKKRKS